MPETPEKLFERAAGSLRTPPVLEWETFPFAGRLEPRPLEPPLPSEPPREGEGSIDCSSCARPDDGYIWTDANWRLIPRPEPGGLPLVLLLESREHFAEPGDLPTGLAGELGVLQAKIDHAMRTIDGFGRVHVCRWATARSTFTGGSSRARPACRSYSAASRRSGTRFCLRLQPRYGRRTSSASSPRSAADASLGPS